METADESILRHINIMVRWHVDRATTWIRQNLPGMAESRIDGSPKDYEDVEDLRNLVRLAVRAGGQHYHEGGGDKRLLTLILSVLSVLTTAFIIGGITLYGEVRAIARGQFDHDRRIESLERINERRYRDADAPP